LKIQDAHIAALSQADIMDLRNVEVRAVRATKRFVIRTPLALHLEEGPVFVSEVFDEAPDIMDLTAAVPPAYQPRDEFGNVQEETPPRQAIEEEEKVDEEEEVELEEDHDEEEDEEADAAIDGQEEDNDGNRKSLLYSTLTADDFPSFRSFLSCIGDEEDEGDDDEAVDLLMHPHQSIFYDQCQHKGEEITSGSSGPDESSSSSMNAWLDDSPVMTGKEKRKVQQFMKKLSGKKRRFR
jgi:hypothetical protein